MIDPDSLIPFGEALDEGILLAGPMLRRVDEEGIWIWLCTSVPMDFHAQVFRYDPKSGSYETVATSLLGEYPGNATGQDIVDGQQDNWSFNYDPPAKPGEPSPSHVHHCWIRCTSPGDTKTKRGEAWKKHYSDGGEFEYEVSFRLKGLKGYSALSTLFERSCHYSDRLSFGTLFPEGRFRLTFFLQGNAELHGAVGSCRKLHGRGLDALLGLAEYFAQNRASQDGPSPATPLAYMFLCGDQIYADDVDPRVASACTAFGTCLQPVASVLDELLRALGDARYPLAELRPFGEGTVQRHHLFALGEHCAMYFLAFSPVLWTWLPSIGLQDNQNGKDASFAFARITANTPTYMLGDDHEFTDDFLFDGAWRDFNLSASAKEGYLYDMLAYGWRHPGSHPVYALGLLEAIRAYWSFQMVGNDPEHFTARFGSILAATASAMKADYHKEEPQEASRDVTECVRALTCDSSISEPLDWNFTVDSRPKTLFMDSRFYRAYASDVKSVTLNGERIEYQGPRRSGNLETLIKRSPALSNFTRDAKDDTLIVVTPTPVFTIPGVEASRSEGNRAAMVRKLKGDNYASDNESWDAAPTSKQCLYEWLCKDLAYGRILFLSGDVHYGYVARGAVRTPTTACQVAQVTASPIKNHLKPGEQIALEAVSGEYGFGQVKKINRDRYCFIAEGDVTIVDLHSKALAEGCRQLVVGQIRLDVTMQEASGATKKATKLKPKALLSLRDALLGRMGKSVVKQILTLVNIATELESVFRLARQYEQSRQGPTFIESMSVTPLRTRGFAPALRNLSDAVALGSVVVPPIRVADMILDTAATVAEPLAKDLLRTDNHIGLVWLGGESSRAKLIPDPNDEEGWFDIVENVVEPLFEGDLTRDQIRAQVFHDARLRAKKDEEERIGARAKQPLNLELLQITPQDNLNIPNPLLD